MARIRIQDENREITDVAEIREFLLECVARRMILSGELKSNGVL